MRRSLMLAMLVSMPFAGLAHEGVELSLRSQSQAAALAAASGPARGADAPFRSRRDPIPELILRQELESRGPRGACEHAASDLCYDLADGRVVYRPARAFMPRIEGMRAESLSLRRDRIVVRYSFR
jgi:hypothetical protein